MLQINNSLHDLIFSNVNAESVLLEKKKNHLRHLVSLCKAALSGVRTNKLVIICYLKGGPGSL